MISRTYREKIPVGFFTIDPSCSRLQRVDSVENGVLSKQSEFKEVSCVEMNAKLLSKDFNIANLLELGVVSKLKPVTLRANNVDGFIDSFEKAFENVESTVS